MPLFQQRNIYTTIIAFAVGMFLCSNVSAQCPPNIDFERGDFSNWTAYTGNVSATSGQNVITLSANGPGYGNQHEIFSRVNNAGDRDQFGGFPVVCPNGSGYSVKLGNTTGGAQAEGLSYEFTIPANMNTYSITYHYAVVFEGPNHRESEQPRLEMEVLNVTDGKVIDCSSFKFIPFGSALPGFFEAPTRQTENTPVWCKDWTAVTINLNNQAGKTIRLFFKTADCTFVRHFGYAYIDVNTECTGEFTGATYCPNDTLVNVVAPYGFQGYQWFNSNFTQVLGTSQSLSLRPPYPVGELLAVEVTPFNGYGCKDTLYARLLDTLSLKANAGKDAVFCGTTPVLIGENAKPGLTYRWSPATGLSDPNIANPFASPPVSTNYVVTVYSGGGGCFKRDTVLVKSSNPDTTISFAGKYAFCSTSGDSAVVSVQPGALVQWYKNNLILSGATQNSLRIIASGTYHAVLRNVDGCELQTRSVTVEVEDPQKGITYPIRYTFINMPITLQARTFGNEVLWNPPAFLSDAASVTPVFERPSIGNQLYNIRIISRLGCITIDTQFVKTIPGVTVYLPNAFTPNNDNLNDRFYPITDGIKEVYSFKIFSRWGVELYSWKVNDPGWDGTFKGVPQVPGTYVWQFSGIGIDEKVYTRKGTITLIR
ncbi:T9SS type B sorting domain-containing protein [Lacibacter luteus]|uniref:T9SS type B sorting domain-containing protein n=1 Tax=Lacibacter luteus TaxID=2508719 RepID=A0A4Q1CGF0_9BACT|nr:T9SS type B sorting domain-containing protein [Lacibacter luteus]RXK58901.1 T9SS type B sorting domain-containing protein [Lacibacter luteus]